MRHKKWKRTTMKWHEYRTEVTKGKREDPKFKYGTSHRDVPSTNSLLQLIILPCRNTRTQSSRSIRESSFQNHVRGRINHRLHCSGGMTRVKIIGLDETSKHLKAYLRKSFHSNRYRSPIKSQIIFDNVSQEDFFLNHSQWSWWQRRWMSVYKICLMPNDGLKRIKIYTLYSINAFWRSPHDQSGFDGMSSSAGSRQKYLNCV